MFNCGSEPLDRYFRQQVTQDIVRHVTACFVAVTKKKQIAGFYTLASGSIPLTDLPADMGKKLPRYTSVASVRLKCLAVDQAFQGQGVGGALVADALLRVCHSEIAVWAILVDAKDKSAADFYQRLGFISLPNALTTLLLPLSRVRSEIVGQPEH